MEKDIDRQGARKAARVRERLITLSVIVEKRLSTHRWQKHRWRAVAVEPARNADRQDDGMQRSDGGEGWQLLDEGEGWWRYRACDLDLDLHRKETEGYKYNLAGAKPSVYVLMRPSDDPSFPWRPVELSVSPYDALSGTEVGDDQVDDVPMGPVVETLVRDFVDRHHVDQPFIKRKRKDRNKRIGELSDFERLGGKDV